MFICIYLGKRCALLPKQRSARCLPENTDYILHKDFYTGQQAPDPQTNSTQCSGFTAMLNTTLREKKKKG